MGLVQLSLDNTVVTDAGLRQVAGECVMVSIHMGGADDDRSMWLLWCRLEEAAGVELV